MKGYGMFENECKMFVISGRIFYFSLCRLQWVVTGAAMDHRPACLPV